MSKAPRVVFLFDVDNTLIDNDRVQADLSKHLEQTYGAATRDRYWEIFEELRNELGYADYLGALERYRIEAMHRPEVLRISSWLVDYPFADRLYPGALDAVKHVQQWGSIVILSDGDAVLQLVTCEHAALRKQTTEAVVAQWDRLVAVALAFGATGMRASSYGAPYRPRRRAHPAQLR